MREAGSGRRTPGSGRAAVIALGLLLCSAPARAQDAGASVRITRQALVQAVRTTGSKGNGACLECHKDSHADARHAEKEVGCRECHSNVADGARPHKGALDTLPLDRMCGQCHAAVAQRQTTGVHKGSGCDSCHGSEHQDFKRTDWSACRGCHGDQSRALATSVHGSGARKVGCGECHGDVHDPKRKTDPLSPMSKVLQISTCGECHNTPYVRSYGTSVHGQGVLRSGLSVAPACTDCHGAHDIAAAKTPESRVSKQNVVGTCDKCHSFVVTRWKTSAHGQRWAQEQAGSVPYQPEGDGRPRHGPVCTTCHQGHLTYDPMVYGNYLRMADTCGTCHHEQGVTYRDSFHGKATRLGMAAAATCADCHTPHEMLSSGDPRSTVNPKNLETTCGKCHQPVNASFLQFDPHMNPRDPSRNQVVHFVWLFMTALLVGVLAFFALHSLLWLQRSIVAARRGELPHHGAGAVWIRRFSPLIVGIHVAIVITFLLLAATGLPLKFGGEGWPRFFEALFGGPAAARWIHRAAGVATFGYGAVYLGYLIREIVLRRRLSLLGGWESMVPNKKDLEDLIANLRWFLYRGPPPKIDRWSYWEKFDFFAVFWGIPVIGLSGLMLWVPLWVTRILPGWALNVAALIHSDEALLAVGFIFFFHFFHTHLRPEAFPLDTVVFLGRMPLERFKVERPAAYARLSESGELHKHLAPAPTREEVRRAYLFGGVALVIGTVLGVLLLVVGLGAIFR